MSRRWRCWSAWRCAFRAGRRSWGRAAAALEGQRQEGPGPAQEGAARAEALGSLAAQLSAERLTVAAQELELRTALSGRDSAGAQLQREQWRVAALEQRLADAQRALDAAEADAVLRVERVEGEALRVRQGVRGVAGAARARAGGAEDAAGVGAIPEPPFLWDGPPHPPKGLITDQPPFFFWDRITFLPFFLRLMYRVVVHRANWHSPSSGGVWRVDRCASVCPCRCVCGLPSTFPCV